MEKMLTLEERAARRGLSVEAYQNKLNGDIKNWRAIKVRRDVYEEVARVADLCGLTHGEATSLLLEHAILRARLQKVPVYRYELVFVGDDAPEEEQA